MGINGADLEHSHVATMTCSVHKHVFEVKTQVDLDLDGEFDVFVFACKSKEERKVWINKLRHMGHSSSINLQTFQTFKLAMNDRRLAVEDKDLDQFEPVFKSKLWKLKSRGDRGTPEHWWEREMWIARNGSLVFWSVREKRELVCYTSSDMSRATVTAIPDAGACRPFAFQVKPRPVNGIEFAPGEFAAPTRELCDQWISKLAALR